MADIAHHLVFDAGLKNYYGATQHCIVSVLLDRDGKVLRAIRGTFSDPSLPKPRTQAIHLATFVHLVKQLNLTQKYVNQLSREEAAERKKQSRKKYLRSLKMKRLDNQQGAQQ